jgi:hypothetical protein
MADEYFIGDGTGNASPLDYLLFSSWSQFITNVKGTSPEDEYMPEKRKRFPSDVTSYKFPRTAATGAENSACGVPNASSTPPLFSTLTAIKLLRSGE